MALQSDDCDIREAYFSIELGGNGDYYLTTVEVKDQFDRNGELQALRVLSSVRVAMSGGNAPHEVKMAVLQLHKALEQSGLNKHPIHELEEKRTQDD